MSRFSIFCRKFFVSQCRKYSQATLVCCVSENFRWRKSLWIRGGGVVSRFSVENFFSLSAEKIRRVILNCCISSGYRKSLEKKGGGEVTRFYVECFCLTVPKKLVGEPFNVSLTPDIEKIWIRRGGSYQDFLSKIFCFTLPKNSVGESSIVALISGTEKVWRRGGGVEYQDFPSNTFCLTVPKQFAGNPSVLCFRNFPVAKKFVDKRGGSIKVFCRIFFVSQCRKLS